MKKNHDRANTGFGTRQLLLSILLSVEVTNIAHSQVFSVNPPGIERRPNNMVRIFWNRSLDDRVLAYSENGSTWFLSSSPIVLEGDFLAVYESSASGNKAFRTMTLDGRNCSGIAAFVNVRLLPSPGTNLIANPLYSLSDHLNQILPLPPSADGTTITRWDHRSQNFKPPIVYLGGEGWFADNPNDLVIHPGEAFYLDLQNPGPLTATFIGEVPQGDLSLPIGPGVSFLASQLPTVVNLAFDGFPAVDGDMVRLLDTAQRFQDYFYIEGFGWDPEAPVIRVGSGFILVRVGPPRIWTRFFLPECFPPIREAPCSTPTAVPIVQQAYLKALNIHADDQFGTSVSISGDTLVVGAPLEDSSAGADSGAAYVFVRSGASWGPPVQLKAPNPGAGDKFGSSVAIFGNTVVVGAPGEDSSATGVGGNQGNNSALNSGAAYVFVRNGMNWTQPVYLKASNTGAEDQFGSSVAISGNTVVVGAPGEDSNGTQSDNSAPASGAAYVFTWNGTWSQQAYLKASNRESSDEFGTSVAVSENTVVVGSPGEDSNATGVEGNQANNSAPGAGAAYVFVWNGATWNQQAYLKASNTESADRFGERVQVSYDRIVVGATGEDSNATGVDGNQSNNSAPESGAAYVFVRNVTSWTQQAYLKGCNTEANDFFGRSVGVSADTVVVGAHLEDSGATGINGNASDNGTADSGAVYVFVRSGMSWVQQAYLKASNTGAGDNFGYSVGVSAESLVVGAIGEASSDGRQNDNGALKSGAAYAFANLGLRPPGLRVDKSGNMVTICWPLPGTGYVLMQTPSLTSPVWTQVPPSSYVTNATEICVTLTVPSGVDARFFRLCQCLP